MKVKYLILAVAAAFIYGCGSSMPESNEIPEGLAAKKQLLASKKQEMHDLKSFITTLSMAIADQEPRSEKDPVLVRIDTVTPGVFKRYKEIQANVVSTDRVYASSETGGRILKLHVRENDYVSKGQRIADIDMETIEKQIAELETTLSLARTVFERQQRLWDQNIGSEIQYLEAKNNKERLEKSLETLQAQLKKQFVYAPLSGVVETEFLKQGEMASPGAPIVEILNTSRIKVEAAVPENLLGTVDRGDLVEIVFPALNERTTKRITSIGRTIDPANRTFKVEIEMGNRKGILKPNLLAMVKFVDYTQDNAILVPTNLILEEVDGRQYLYKALYKDTITRAVKSYVELGESDESHVVIEKGLFPGDMIIIDGGIGISNNDPVKIINSEARRNG